MKKLKAYILGNAMLNLIGGVFIFAFNGPLNQFFKIENNLAFRMVGITLLLFGLFALYVSVKQITNKKLVKSIILLNTIWFAASIIIGFFGLFNLSDRGYLAIMIAGVFIGFLAAKQHKHAKSI